MRLLDQLPGPLAKVGLFETLLARLGFVRLARYTDRLAITDALGIESEARQLALAQLEARVERMAKRCAPIEAERDQLSGELEVMRDDLAAAESALEDLRRELTSAQLEACTHKRDLDKLLAARRPGPLHLDPAAKDKAIEYLKAHGADDETLPHILALLADAVFGPVNDAADERLPDAETKYHLGRSRALLDFKTHLEALIAEGKLPA